MAAVTVDRRRERHPVFYFTDGTVTFIVRSVFLSITI